MSLSSGTKLGRYEIRSKIGEGGMGEVYLAKDTKLDRKVALKILPAEVASHHDRMRRFVQEAKAVSALNHPNILTIHEIDESDTGHFIATEFIDGWVGYLRLATAANSPLKENPWLLARAYIELGEKDKAFAELNNAYESRTGVAFLKVEPQLDPLRSDPRFQELMKKVGLPQ